MVSTERLDQLAAAASMGARTQIDDAAQRAFDRLWSLMLKPGAKSPRDLVLQVAAEFNLGASEALAAAFSVLLERLIGPAEVQAMPVGDVVLSRLLYRHAVQTAAEVTAIVREHAQGVHDARALLLRLYDGYDPQDGIQRPLEGRAIASLPRALREIVAEPGPRADLAALLDDAQRQASRVKSRALRSGYLDLLSTWESGAAREVLRKKLDVAHREKSRFMADRIAQTELARAYQARVAAEVMADTETTVVQVMLNPAHPALDICDLHATADLWGLGKGCYPKEEAPRPPFHPYCWCRVRGRQDLQALAARRAPKGEARYLAGRDAQDPGVAGRIMGSAERARRVIGGEPLEAVVNEGKDPAHHLVRLGDPKATVGPIGPG